ncbi:MAG TPA: spore coat U domain-containing protein [Allosphingosinicella sp.]|jgi:spore coat protein U-like protein
MLSVAFAATAWTAPAEACTIGAVGVNFGAYDPRSATAADGTGSVTLNCPKNTKTASVSISTGGSGSYAQRRMTSGSSVLNYNLHTNASRTTIWGNGSGGTATITVGDGSTTLPIYGRIPTRQNVRAGTYSDTTTITVTF